MPLNTVTTGNTVLASDVNQLVYVLQRQSGQNEIGDYYLTLGAYATSAFIGYFVSSLSRTSVPTGVVIDTSLQAASNFNAPATDHLTANGFHVYASSTGININCNVGGQYTISY